MDSMKGSQGWNKSKRHSSQGYSLIDLIGVDRLKKLLPNLQRAGVIIVEAFASFDDLVLLVDIRFKAMFFAGQFGDVDMAEAAEIYHDVLVEECNRLNLTVSSIYKAETNQKLRVQFFTGILKSLDIRKFRALCIVEGKEMPKTDAEVFYTMHLLRTHSTSSTMEECRVSRAWLKLHRRPK